MGIHAVEPRRFPSLGRGRKGKIIDYCSRDMVPPWGGASRNRKTIN